MEATRQRVRSAAACKKEEEKTKVGESSSTLRAIGKGAAKRKADGKDERPSKKPSVTPREKLPKIPSPPKHRAGKGLMMTPSPFTQDSKCRLLTHKDYAIENMTYGQEQYKNVLRTLNQEVKELKEKPEEEGHQRKKDQEAKETAEK